MKIIYSLFFVLCSLTLVGQNYQNICSPGYTFYEGASSLLNEYHYDSVGIIDQDTIYYSFYTIHRTTGECANTHSGPLLCRVVRKRPDGWFIFLDRNTDSIKFNTQAGLDQTFVCRTIYGNRPVEAKVISIRQDTVIDTVDQVKEIMFTVKNPDGTVFPHVINGTTVILSQHFGFSKTIDFNTFPNYPDTYKLIGKSSPQRGLQGFGWPETYDFEIGDEFHYSGELFGMGGGPYYESIRKILDKTIYGNNDEVKYVKEICYTYFNYPGLDDIHDTIIEIYDFASLSNNPILLYAPYEMVPDNNYEYAPEVNLQIRFNCRPAKLFWERAFEYYGSPPCWKESTYYQRIKYEYSTGLGKTYSFWGEPGFTTYNYGYENLVYFKKGNEEWGTPVAEDCNVLLSTHYKKNENKVSLTFSPNPVEQSATIQINGIDNHQRLLIGIYDMLGMNVMTIPIAEEHANFIRGGLPSGLYLYILRSGQGQTLSTGRVILE